MEDKALNIKKLLGLERGTISIQDEDDNIPHPKLHYKKLGSQLDIDEIYFSGDYPTIYIKHVKKFDKEVQGKIRELQKTIWNQGKVAFLYVSSTTEIRVYNCYHRPINPNDENQDINDTLLISASKDDNKALKELVDVFGKVSIDTGTFWKKEDYAKSLTNQSRVNEALIKNLRYTRNKLFNEFDVPLSIIHDLLLRSLFLLYLEDRGATNKEFYQDFHSDAKSYYDILDLGPDITYQLYAKLEASFNGNLCPITEDEKSIITNEHLKFVKNCFWDEIEINGQKKLFDWKAFDFKHIPIELISEIYEDFILNEEGTEKKSKDGAYYTPHSLVEFILNKALPWGDPYKNHNETNVKILDPTCGSGIFLVEAFKRLVDRWECNNPGKKKTFDVLKNIVENNIYGIEYNPEAIKVAAFSIYLAMLDQLEPRSLWKDKRFPYLIFDPENENKKTTGANLFLMSSLKDGPYSEIDFDLVVGNPPFKEGDLDKETTRYVDEREFPREKVVAFLHRAAKLCPNGQIALVAGAKPVLFNMGTKYQSFRRYLFNECDVKEVYNFASLRKTSKKHGGNLFESAVGPACVLFYKATTENLNTDKIIYCSPTTAIRNNLIDGVVIDQIDLKYLPKEECQKGDSKIWKIAMWGTSRDFHLIRSLSSNPSLENEFEKFNWSWGNGYQTSKPQNKTDKEISKIPTLDTRSIKRYKTGSDGLVKTPDRFRRLGAKEAYSGPHVVLKKGLKNKKFCASLVEFDSAFRDGVYGISAPEKEIKHLKALTAYINSKLSSYFLFLSISSLGVEREQVMLEEYLSMPSFLGEVEEAKLNKLASLYDEVVTEKENIMKTENQIQVIEENINQVIFDIFDISKEEEYLVEDMVEYSLDLFLNGETSRALKPNNKSDTQDYLKVVCNNINELLSNNQEEIRATGKIFNLPKSFPLSLVSVVFDKNSNDKTNRIKGAEYKQETSEILKEIEEYTYEKFSESIFFRKIVKYESGNAVYLIKPNEKRFWSKSQALNDADKIIFDILEE
ncbi:SAM-dependent methyltransferase [Aliifodinibius sp. S!AR15-10]|uniref:HsdM family class I SAM-dependent methyltransferase n=1 Tax=Aliifodinibius sp. S!AR15-10 TaxID=2950437 RepID=UPI00286619CC|nr:N-6 DNA methylase [Aliifodinibius sp. S!AR15-10]MDR8389887.1 SAM-dependent methyltransferase [Aliifodinibius sp. S!AR15-10]